MPHGTATADQVTELRALISVILRNDTESDRAEALNIALADPADALISFRALVALEKLPWELELLP